MYWFRSPDITGTEISEAPMIPAAELRETSSQAPVTRLISNEPALATSLTNSFTVAFSMFTPVRPNGRVERSNLIKVRYLLPSPTLSRSSFPNLLVEDVCTYVSSLGMCWVARALAGQRNRIRNRVAVNPMGAFKIRCNIIILLR
jgi:hypothetical protein